MIPRYIARRMATCVIQLLGRVVAVFFLIRLLPADPVARLFGLNASPEAYAQAKHSLGLDQPTLTHFLQYFGIGPGAHGLLQGVLGVSWVTNRAVLTEIGQMLPVTMQLLTLSFVATILIAAPVGMASPRRPGEIVDRIVFIYGRSAARVVIAPGFAEIFLANCFRNALLPITLEAPALGIVTDAAGRGEAITVDLRDRAIVLADGRHLAFVLDRSRRDALLEGWDETEMILRSAAADFAGFELRQRRLMPWLAAGECGS